MKMIAKEEWGTAGFIVPKKCKGTSASSHLK
jgi:hypothetical protein